MSHCVLIVDPNEGFRDKLLEVAQALGCTTATRADFETARKDLASTKHSVLIAPIKLGSFNGIHLVHIAKRTNPSTRCIVYGNDDPGLGVEAQEAGAFFERTPFLPFSLQRYLTADLPGRDRRDVHCVDRRLTFRGGRRATDRAELHATVSSLPRL